MSVARADARRLPLQDSSVDLIVTSPPYFGLRSYTDGGTHYDGQVGDEASPAEFLDALLEVTAECARVLKPTGSLFVNLGDAYMTRQFGYGGGDGGSWAKVHRHVGDGRENGTVRDDRVGGRGVSRSNAVSRASGIPRKSLLGLPWRYALRCVDELGLILRAELVWSKPNGLPESVNDRVRRSHEQWFHLTPEPRYYSAIDELREPHLPQSIARSGRNRFALDLAREGTGHAPNTLDPAQAVHPLGALPGSVWTVATEPLTLPEDLGVNHYAAFPSEWPRRLILGWSPPAVCTACGEGLRPVCDRTPMQWRPSPTANGRQAPGASRATMTGTMLAPAETRIVGHACACDEPIGTPTGTQTEPDPSLVTGRAGLNRPRTGEEGRRVVTRHEQRHEADQLRHSPHRLEMQAEAGPAFAHYLRTDRTGARPIPEPLREAWRGRGWLEPAPPFERPPTRPAVVLDPFGGTGTTAHVADALGRVGVSLDLSADYCRVAADDRVRRLRYAKVHDKPTPVEAPIEQESLW